MQLTKILHFFTLLLIIVVGFFIALNTGLNFDGIIHLSIAQKILNNEVLYQDVMVINPPIQYYLRIASVLISNLSGFDLISVDFCIVTLVAALSIFLSYYCQLGRKQNNNYLSLIVFTLTLFYLPALFNFWGQKEHLMMILGLPAIWMILGLYEGIRYPKGLQAILAICLGLAVSIKPFFLISLLLAHFLTIILTKRSFLTAILPITISTSVTCLLTFSYFILTDYLTLINSYGPLYYFAHLGMQGFSNHFQMFRPTIERIIFFPIPLLLIFLLPHPNKFRTPVLWIIILAFTFFTAGLIQGKFWLNHFYPAYCLLLLGTAESFNLLLKQRADFKKYILKFATFSLCLLVFFCFNHFFLTYKQSQVPEISTSGFFSQDAKDSIYISSLGVGLIRELLDNHIDWNNNYYSSWPIWGYKKIQDLNMVGKFYTEDEFARIKQDILFHIKKDLCQPNIKKIIINNDEVQIFMDFISEDPEISTFFNNFTVSKNLFTHKNIPHHVFLRNN